MTLNQFLNNKNTISLTFINNYITLQNQTDFYIKQLYSHLCTKGSKTITIPFDFYYFEKHNSKKLISSSLKKSEDLTSSNNFSALAAVSSNRQLSAVDH